jgi:hypothetical protein
VLLKSEPQPPTHRWPSLNYFEAVQLGRKRVNAAVEFLQPIAGVCHPMLFLKMGVEEWTPVGEEILFAFVPGKNSTVGIVVCDRDGNAKAMSDWFSESEGERISGLLSEKGTAKFEGEVKLPI